MQNLLEYIFNISVYFLLLPSLVFLIRWRHCKFPEKVAGIYIILASIMSLSAMYLSKNGVDTRIFSFLNPCVDIICLSLFFCYFFSDKYIKISFFFICFIYCSIMGYSYFTNKAPFIDYTLINIETTFIIVIMSLLMNNYLRKNQGKNLFSDSIFWIIIYFIASNIISLGLTLFINDIYAYSKEIFELVWYGFSPIFTIANCVILAYAFWITKNAATEKY